VDEPRQQSTDRSEGLWLCNHACFRFAEAAAQQFTADLDDLESGSKTATSVAYIKNHLSDAQKSLTEAEGGNRGALV
jgi:hypothetical protein